MSSRANIVAESAALLSSVKALEKERNDLKSEITAADARVDEQKKQASLISAIMKRNELPSLDETEQRLSELQAELAANKQRQEELRQQTQELQAQIDYSIAIRGKRAQYEKLLTDVRALASTYDTEKQRESDLKLAQTRLSSELLKHQLNKRQIEEKLAQIIEEPPDPIPIQKKKQGLIEQTKLMRKKREIFEQELAEADEHLSELKGKREELVELAQRAEAMDPDEIQHRILEMAAQNLDLRVWKPLVDGTEAEIADMHELEQSCDALIARCKEVTK